MQQAAAAVYIKQVWHWQDEQQPTVTLTAIQMMPKLNNQTAHICGFDGEKMRYRVRLQNQQIKNLLPSKIILSAGLEVTLTGLTAQAFNGKTAVVLSYDATSGRSVVELLDTKKKMAHHLPGDCDPTPAAAGVTP